MIRALPKRDYLILSVGHNMENNRQSSVDGTVRMWDIRKPNQLKMITILDSFSILSYFVYNSFIS